jgi:hypothetical protein
MERYPLRLGDVSPGDHFVRIALSLSWNGLPEGRHTGGPFTDGKEIWKPLDACPGPGVPYRLSTLEDVFLNEMYATAPSLFPKNWRVEQRRGRRFLVRPWLRVAPFSYSPAQITRGQVLLVERMVRTANEQWWWVNDDLNVAFDPAGHPLLLDLSNAQRANPTTAQGSERPREERQFEEWAEIVAGHSELVRLRRAARHLVSSIRWERSEYASGRSEPRRWVYAAERSLPLEMETALDCRVCACEREGLGIRSWCIASGSLADAVVKAYGLQVGWTPLQYVEGRK